MLREKSLQALNANTDSMQNKTIKLRRLLVCILSPMMILTGFRLISHQNLQQRNEANTLFETKKMPVMFREEQSIGA